MTVDLAMHLHVDGWGIVWYDRASMMFPELGVTMGDGSEPSLIGFTSPERIDYYTVHPEQARFLLDRLAAFLNPRPTVEQPMTTIILPDIRPGEAA